jgi:hypothetical protein
MSEIDLAALAADVRYLKDRAEIIDALNRYTRGLDRLDRDLCLSAYHPDATDDRGAPLDPVEQEARGLVRFGRDARVDHISNFTIEIKGDEAHSEAYVITSVLETEAADEVVMGGARYVDRLVRHDGRWAIMHREVIMDYQYCVPTRHLAPEIVTGLRDRRDRSYARPLALSDEALARVRVT